MSGTIVSLNDSSLVLSHGMYKKQTTFKVNPDTKREGALSAGSKATVMYHDEGKQHTATSIHATASHASASKPATAKPAKSS